MWNLIKKWALPLFFFALPWQTRWIFGQELIVGQPFEFGVLSLYATEVLLGLIAIGYLAARFHFSLKRSPLLFKEGLGVVILLLIATFSILVSDSWQLAAVQLMHFVFAVILFFILIDSRTDFKLCTKAFIAGLMIPLALGLFQVITGGSPASTIFGLAIRQAETLGDSVVTLENGTRILRAYGSFSHPNIFGGYLAIGALSLIPILSEAKSLQKWNWIILAILLIGLITTYSQSAWLGILFGLGSGLAISCFKFNAPLDPPVTEGERSTPLLFREGLGVVTIVILISASVIAGIFSLQKLGFNNPSITERVAQYQDWPQVMKGDWILGLGIGNYTYAIEALDGTREWWMYQPVHNTFLLIWSETGLIGLVILVLFIVSITPLSPLLKRGEAYTGRTPLLFKEGSGVVIMLVTLLIIASLDHYLWTSWSGLALCAYVLAMSVRARYVVAQ